MDANSPIFWSLMTSALVLFLLLTKLTDRYPFRGAIKGGFTWLKPKVIGITSNSHPFQWYPDISDFDKAAIERRITEITVVE